VSGEQDDRCVWSREVLDFWFTEVSRKDWFRSGSALDTAILRRFGALYHRLADLPVEQIAATPQSSLAACIVLDQFPRNMFRGTAAAFATDAKARRVADIAISRGFDRQSNNDERCFFYLPFEHSEDLRDQARSVELFEELGDPENTYYALAHQAVIQRFGRFPHRNRWLGRTSTPAEEDFLRQPASSF
jgi:uncharacterized protein (DUF924 family)